MGHKQADGKTIEDYIREAREAESNLRAAMKDLKALMREYEESRRQIIDDMRAAVEGAVGAMIEAVAVREIEKMAKLLQKLTDDGAKVIEEKFIAIGDLFLNGPNGDEPIEAAIRQRRLEWDTMLAPDRDVIAATIQNVLELKPELADELRRQEPKSPPSRSVNASVRRQTDRPGTR